MVVYSTRACMRVGLTFTLRVYWIACVHVCHVMDCEVSGKQRRKDDTQKISQKQQQNTTITATDFSLKSNGISYACRTMSPKLYADTNMSKPFAEYGTCNIRRCHRPVYYYYYYVAVFVFVFAWL